jgi:hypothetical protein
MSSGKHLRERRPARAVMGGMLATAIAIFLIPVSF